MNILLLCSTGLSTGLLVQKMREAAQKAGIKAHIWNCNSVQGEQELAKADVILIGPQLRHLYLSIAAKAADCPIRMIDMMTYGRMDGVSALQTAIHAWEERKHDR